MGGAETLSASLGQCPEGPKQGVASYHVLWSAPPPHFGSSLEAKTGHGNSLPAAPSTLSSVQLR